MGSPMHERRMRRTARRRGTYGQADETDWMGHQHMDAKYWPKPGNSHRRIEPPLFGFFMKNSFCGSLGLPVPLLLVPFWLHPCVYAGLVCTIGTDGFLRGWDARQEVSGSTLSRAFAANSRKRFGRYHYPRRMSAVGSHDAHGAAQVLTGRFA
jgi:hypothetical protein